MKQHNQKADRLLESLGYRFEEGCHNVDKYIHEETHEVALLYTTDKKSVIYWPTFTFTDK